MYGAAADRGAAAASSGTASASSSSSTRKQQGEAGMVAKLQRWIEETLREPVLAFHTSHSRGSSNSSEATSEALSHALADGVLLCRLAEAIRYACDLSVCMPALAHIHSQTTLATGLAASQVPLIYTLLQLGRSCTTSTRTSSECGTVGSR